MSNPFKIKKEKYLYYSFALISLILTLLLYSLLKDQLSPLRMEIKSEYDIGNKNEQIMYHDFEGNGISHKINLFRLAEQNISVLAIQNKKDEVISQFNLIIDHPLRSESIIFHDVNHDQKDDILMFYQNKDSVFLGIIKYKEKFPGNKYFIISKPDSVTNKIWDIIMYPIGIRTKNDEQHLYFYVRGGYSKYPRNLYDYNLSTHKIENTFVTNASFLESFFYDINNDGTDELIISTYSSGNVSNKKNYSDQKSYVFVLDLNLKLLFPVLIHETPLSIFTISPFKIQDKNYIFLLMPKYGKTYKVKAEVIDQNGKIIKSKNFTANHISSPFFYQENHQNSNLYLVLDKFFIMLDNNLDEIKKIETFDNTHILNALKTNNFSRSLILLYKSTQPFMLVAYSPNLKKLAELKLPCSLSLNESQNLITEKLTRDKSKHQLQFIGVKKNFLISIKENPHAQFLYLYFFLTFLLLFLFISGGHQIGKRISLYLHYFIHSLRDTAMGILVLNNAGKTIYKNYKLHQILRIDDAYKKSTHYKKLLNSTKELVEVIDSAIESNQKVDREFTIRKGDETINGEIRITPFTSFYGLTYAYTIEISDFSKMILSDRMRSWSSTAQKIAHDIKTPLSTIQLNLKAIQRRMEKEAVTNQEIYNEDIGRIRNELERIKTLSKNFLKFANLDKPDCKKVDIGKLIKDSFVPFDNYTKENVKVEFNFEASAKYVWADPNQLEQLLHILIENSIDSMKGEGTIRISCCLVQQLQQVNERWIEIEFSDNGSGISEDNLSKVFEPYFTTKVDGTGFGLALAHKIVKDHNGKINIYSKENMGTTFRILLPAVENDLKQDHNKS